MRFYSSCGGLLALFSLVHASSAFLAPRNHPVGDTKPVDISGLIDSFVETWKQNNPGLGASGIAQITDTAQKIKDALLNPPNEAKRTPDPHLIPRYHVPLHLRHQGNLTLEKARLLVRDAQRESNLRNRERFQNPRSNSYYEKLNPETIGRFRAADMAAITVNQTVAAAAAMVAEADAHHGNYTPLPSLPQEVIDLRNNFSDQDPIKHRSHVERDTSAFWMEDIEHIGRVPFGGQDNDGYKVFRNVKDYGAVGDGITDDTAAINSAIKDQGRCGSNCGSSTVKPAIVYFPSGTFLVSSPIIAYYNTQMIGNALSLPTIKAAASFVGLGVISSDVYAGGDGASGEWYFNQNNFLRQLRNFKIDVTEADMTDIAGLHWQVAQATSIQNVHFYMSPSAGKSHVGIFAENGSGGFVSDLFFYDGAVGMQCGNQQFSTRSLTFNNCRIAIDMLWDWGWTWKYVLIHGAQNGITVRGNNQGGSLILLDSFIYNTPVGINVTSPNGATSSETFSITIDNLRVIGVDTTVKHESAGVTLAGSDDEIIESWIFGKTYDQDHSNGQYQSGPLAYLHPKTEALTGANGYFQRSKPQYSDITSNTFLSARIGTLGDGVSDDTFGLSVMINIAALLKRPLYIPFGSYIITSTIKIPVGSQIVGECWAQIVAKGTVFEDIHNPMPMIKVGEYGDKGLIEIQDVMFTTQGPTAGLILMEWNVAESEQGSAAMWDSHFRVGGAKGSGLQAADCPKLTGKVNPNCIAGSMLLHMTESSSGYLENIWAWAADHDMDSGTDQTQIDIYVARGILIESRGGPVWMYGISSEHSVLYQYHVYGAENIFLGMIQAESPYFLPTPQAPAPFEITIELEQFASDPDFKECSESDPHCAAAWGLMLTGATNVQILGAGLSNWFQDYTQPCVDSQDCQQRVVWIQDSGNVWMYNLYTIGTVEMISYQNTTPIAAKDNTNMNQHPFTSIINAWLVASSGEGELFYDGIPEIEDYVVDPQLAPCLSQFSTLGQIVNGAAAIPQYCFDTYIAQVELDILNLALQDFGDLIGDGYDKKFEIYQRAVQEQAPASVDAYMTGAQATGIWQCTEKESVICCKDCSSASGCSNGCDKSKDCVTGTRQVGVDCPTTISDPYDIYSPPPPEFTYLLSNKDNFSANISEKYGVLMDWLSFGDRLARFPPGCEHAGANVQDCIKKQGLFWHGYPVLGNIALPNPKDAVTASYTMSKALAVDAADAQRFAPYDAGVTSITDVVDALSLPSLLLSGAVDSMKQVVETADKIIEEERKTDIANFITAIFMLIPFAGEAGVVARSAILRTIVAASDDLANIALSIYQVVDDPSSALETIFGFFLGGGVGRQPWKDAAAAKRGMPESEHDHLPPKIKTDLDTIQSLRTACLKK
ncbi:exo-1,3-beta-D-glucanase [Xylaria sp. FL0933]|nr:exo-1,3-beta-D-glucanase [Xylaria sp. FL0933]